MGHHKPPDIARSNEAIINKRTVVYLAPEEVKRAKEHRRRVLARESEQQGLMSGMDVEECGDVIVEEEMPTAKKEEIQMVEVEDSEKARELPTLDRDKEKATE